MPVVDVSKLTYRYGAHTALHDLSFTVPQGALYALLGPNGAGKTTLLQILMGLRRSRAGRVSVMDRDSSALTFRDRESIGYIAEGQSLPKWMRLEQVEAYLAPLYPTWDAALARDLRERFGLDARRKIRTLSRGEQMKAALLCALAPRPRLLLMDEPFTGMDALVKDELVRGLLESAGTEGWTVILSSHDIAELELLADWVGFLDDGHMLVSEPTEMLRARFKRVEVMLADGRKASDVQPPADAMSVERAGSRLTFLVSRAGDDLGDALAESFPGTARVDARDASLREIFIALAKQSPRRAVAGVVS